MKLRHLLLLFISFFFVLPLYAEYFKHIGLSEGLTQPSVMAIYQDRIIQAIWSQNAFQEQPSLREHGAYRGFPR